MSQRQATGGGRAPARTLGFDMGTTLATAGRNTLMFRDCPFCGRTHWSAYVDVLEGAVLACRDRVAPEARGGLEAWADRGGWPVLEIEAFCGP